MGFYATINVGLWVCCLENRPESNFFFWVTNIVKSTTLLKRGLKYKTQKMVGLLYL